MPPPGAWKITRDLPYRLGDRVKVRYGTAVVDGIITEYAGPFGGGGRRLWGVELHMDDVSPPMQTYLPEDALSPADPAVCKPGRPVPPDGSL